MNSSNPPDPIEEKWTAYLDGRLSAAEAAAFEREHSEAATEKVATVKIAQSLRRYSLAPVLRNCDFFNQQIFEAIIVVINIG